MTSPLNRVIQKQSNVDIIEAAIKACSSRPEMQRAILFEIMEDLLAKKPLRDVNDTVRNNKYGWMSDALSDIRFRQFEQDEFLVNPFEVEEGVLECPRCKKSKTFSFQKQTRSADEPMTTFAECIGCRHKWTYSG